MANLLRFAWPRITSPPASSRSTTVQWYGGIQPSRMREPAGGRQPLIAEEILHADRHTGQWTELLAGDDLGVHRAGLLECTFGVDGQEGMHVGVHLRNAIEVRLGDLLRALLACGDPAGQLGGGLVDRGRHQASSSRMRGTRD
ncbi:MAG: hypothetical protein QM775_37005 [Pirellulales bacterium]